MSDRYIGRILPGEDVCDLTGDRVGTVARVYRDDVALPQPEHEDVIEVKTGFMGLGQRLYIPVTAVSDAIEDAIFLSKPRNEFDAAWRSKPEYVDRLTG